MLNKVLLIGNLCKDPELRYTPQGTAVCNLRVAVNRRYKAKNSEEVKEDTCFLTVNVWDKQAESCNEHLKKGSMIYVEGRLQSRSWEDQQQKKHYVTEVVAEKVLFMNRKKEEAEPSGQQQSSEEGWLDDSQK